VSVGRRWAALALAVSLVVFAPASASAVSNEPVNLTTAGYEAPRFVTQAAADALVAEANRLDEGQEPL